MKTLLVAALAISSLAQARHAEACGYRPEPQVYRVTSHVIIDTDRANHRRSFVLFPHERAPEGLAWQHLARTEAADAPRSGGSDRRPNVRAEKQSPSSGVPFLRLAPMSYDATQIAQGSAFRSPVTLTLVGPGGTRVVTAFEHVYLSRSWDFDAPIGALEVPGSDGYSIAIAGSSPRAKWLELANVDAPAKLETWIRAQGIEPYDASSIYASRVPGTDYEAVSVFPKPGKKMITLLKLGETIVGKYTGNPTGAFTNHGSTRLVLGDGARVTTVAL